MARDDDEIADSDGESDVDDAPSPPQSQLLLLPGTDQDQTVPDIDLGVNFSDFLSQSQTHHMNVTQQSARLEDHPEGIEKSTGTTASLKRQIESEQRKLAEQKSSSSTRHPDIKKRSKSSSDSPTVAKTKRRHSELGSTSLMEEGQEFRRKRQHTYGSSSSRLRSSQSDFFAEEHRHQLEESLAEVASSRDPKHSSHQPEDNGRTSDQQTEVTAGIGQHQSGSYNVAVNEGPALQGHDGIQANHVRGTSYNADVFEEYMQMSSGRISKSRSVMGNYESISLDYSDSGLGPDVNANPFGDASQQSVEDIADRTQLGKPEASFTPSKASTLDTVPFSSSRDSLAHNALRPHISGIDGASSLREDNHSRVGPGRSRSFVDPSVLTKYSADNLQELADSNSSSSRKRRKTADGFALNVASTAHADIPPISLAATEETLPPKTETQGKKRGRKPKNQNVEPSNGHHSEPSEEQTEESVECAAKHMSSELHFDDDSIIGLPKEQYKPRPSRSRSKRNAEEEMPPPAQSPAKSIHTPTKQPQTSQLEDTAQPNEPEDTPLTKLKKEKKKNKMKRAKTSAAALLKKSERMLSDGEEDVVWVDSKPATVKMKLPDPVEVKEEYLKTEKLPPEDNEMGPAGAAEISINLPQTEEEPHKQPPKKRGRKKKTAAELPVANEMEAGSNHTTNAPAEAEDTTPVGDEATSNQPRSKASTVREALREQDVNTSHTAIAHPINEDTPTPQQTKASEDTRTTSAGRQKSPENQQQPAPAPPTPQPKSTENSEKGPTKHSPINPTGGKVKYRVGLSRRAAIPPLLKIVRK